MRKNIPEVFKTSTHFYFIIIDFNGNYLYVNPFFRQNFASINNDFVSTSFSNAIFGKDLEKYNSSVKECFSNTGKTVLVELRKPKADGSLYWTRWEYSAILNSRNEPEAIQCLGVDIKEECKTSEYHLQESVQSEVNKHKLLTQATIDGQEKERKEIGKELHDNIGQQLTTTKLFLDIAKGTADDNTLEMVNMAIKSVSDVINEIRRMSHSLVPPTLGDLGLIESVKELCETLKRTETFHIRFYHDQFEENKLLNNQSLMLYRIIQEQINNIIKHSEAKNVIVKLCIEDDHIVLDVSDNGKGFDIKSRKKGLGLLNIINRADLFNGKVEIVSAINKGCKIKVTIPLQQKETNVLI